MKLRILFSLACGALLPMALGCSASSSLLPGLTDSGAEGGSTPDAGSDTGSDAGLDAGTQVFPADATKVVVTDRGGGLIEIPDASTCYPADDTYTLTLPALELTWKVCGSQDGGAYAYVTGSKTLSATEFAPLSTALHALAISTKIQCGADKSSEQVAFTTSSGDAVYLDDFYHCSDDGKAYVSGMDAVLTELGKLAR